MTKTILMLMKKMFASCQKKIKGIVNILMMNMAINQ